VAVKVADGNVRALLPATVAALDQLGLLDAAARQALTAWTQPPVRNYRGIVTGTARAVVVLDKLEVSGGPVHPAANE
jgi:L-asparaginase II